MSFIMRSRLLLEGSRRIAMQLFNQLPPESGLRAGTISGHVQMSMGLLAAARSQTQKDSRAGLDVR